jgi:CheY-like chemotaxis protein
MIVGMSMAVHDGSSLLHGLKRGDGTRHIPTVAAHSERTGESAHQGRLVGALDVIEEPLTRAKVDAAMQLLDSYIERKERSLLVATAEESGSVRHVAEQIAVGDHVQVDVVGTVDEAADAIGSTSYDCVLVDLRLPEGAGFAVIKRVRARKAMNRTPVVVGGTNDLSRRDVARLRKYAESMTITQPRSAPRMFEQVALFLHHQDLAVPDDLRELTSPVDGEELFLGKRILIVDDDVRNVFALASALEQHGIDVLYADNGEAGLDTLRREPAIDLVLMDVMMPGMDGYTAMREIRKMPSFRDLPVIALTAKAMPGDRDNSLTAGASDYVTKPVDVEQLLAVFRTWIP